jgi:hypothetical protein
MSGELASQQQKKPTSRRAKLLPGLKHSIGYGILLFCAGVTVRLVSTANVTVTEASLANAVTLTALKEGVDVVVDKHETQAVQVANDTAVLSAEEEIDWSVAVPKP